MARAQNVEFVHHDKITTYEESLLTTMATGVLAIPVTHPYVAKTTPAGAEALTLANGKPGQTLTVYLIVAGGGDATLTPTTATGWGTIVFADAGDQVTLMYVDDVAGWIVISALGLTAQPEITQA